MSRALNNMYHVCFTLKRDPIREFINNLNSSKNSPDSISSSSVSILDQDEFTYVDDAHSIEVCVL